MLPEIAAASAALNNLAQLAKIIRQAASQSERNELQIQMQGVILDLQSRMAGLATEIDELSKVKRAAEEKLLSYERWDAEAARYELRDIDGMVVMALRPVGDSTAPKHYLCANCFEKKQKSYLNPEFAGAIKRVCGRCGESVFINSPFA